MNKNNYISIAYIGRWLCYIVIVGFLSSLVISLYIYHSYKLPAKIFFQRAEVALNNHSSSILRYFSKPMANIVKVLNQNLPDNPKVVYQLSSVGASAINSTLHQPKIVPLESLLNHYQRLTRFDLGYKRAVEVNTSESLISAIEKAQPGDDIIISPGTYIIKKQQVYAQQHGSAVLPIRIRAKTFGDVEIKMNTLEGIVLMGDFWIVENLKLIGQCTRRQDCEHAIHIVGAQHLIIRNNEIRDFNSSVKANGFGASNARKFPDNVLFEHNSLYNDSVRKTATPVTLLDVVGGNHWSVRKNFIANHSKHGSDYISYAMFLKGGGENGFIEKNIIDCEWTLPNDGHTRVGLSLGGGGTGDKYCRGGRCKTEHNFGRIENNIIINCSHDVGIYLNKAANTQVVHNTILNTSGVDIRFNESSATLINNTISGSIRSRNGGKVTLHHNHTDFDFASLKVPPSVKSQTKTDICDIERYKFSAAGAAGSYCFEQLDFKLFEN